MSTDTHEESPHQNLRCCWPQDFTERRKFHKVAENETYLQWVQADFDDGVEEEYEDEDDDEDESAGDESEGAGDANDGAEDTKGGPVSPKESRPDSFPEAVPSHDDSHEDEVTVDGYNNVQLFMKGMTFDEKNLPYHDQVEKVTMFCGQARSELDPRSICQSKKNVALLDDRNDGGARNGSFAKEGNCRPYLGPLTSRQLRKELARKRLTVSANEPGDPEIDAERRTIFITNLDASTIEALTATASRTQAPTLKNLIYKHLTSRASIVVEIPAHGYRTFSLDFHIPYYVLRESDKMFEDTRKRFDGKPLRKDRSHFLCEAQTSVAVAGIDDWVWVAYGFFDAYFDSEESVEYYHRMSQSSWKAGLGRPDPLSAGGGTGPIWTPREYFLTVFEARILKVLREWRLIMDKVESEVDHSRSYVFPLPLSSNDPKIRQEVRDFSDWNRQMVKLLVQLTNRLSDTVEAWDDFQGKDIWYFLSGGTLSTPSSTLKPNVMAVSKAFSQLKVLLLKLERLRKELCNDNPQGVHAHLGLENNEAAIVQRRTASHVEILTVITIVFYPLALAASLFSTQGVLPFKPNLAYFMYALVILVALLLATLLVCSRWTLWIQSIANYLTALTAVFPSRKTSKDDQSSEEMTNDMTSAPKPLGRTPFRRAPRKVDVATPGELEQGIELDDLRQI